MIFDDNLIGANRPTELTSEARWIDYGGLHDWDTREHLEHFPDILGLRFSMEEYKC